MKLSSIHLKFVLLSPKTCSGHRNTYKSYFCVTRFYLGRWRKLNQRETLIWNLKKVLRTMMLITEIPPQRCEYSKTFEAAINDDQLWKVVEDKFRKQIKIFYLHLEFLPGLKKKTKKLKKRIQNELTENQKLRPFEFCL